jgi:hypothetical protein
MYKNSSFAIVIIKARAQWNPHICVESARADWRGIMSENEQERLEQAQKSKRNFLAIGARNLLAIGAIAASAAVVRATRAVASDCDADDRCCFLRGTKIQTVLGERNVEDLAIGDLLPTVFGGVRPIQWIGRYRYKKSNPSKPWAKYARPVQISSSALAPNVPHTDLYVTPGHALFIDGVLVPVGRLINGTTIALYGAVEYDELEYFHIKLETHDVIHAEGAWCETLLSVDETASNFADYLRRYGAPETQDLLCAPVLFHGARAEIRSRLRSVMSPGPQKLDIIRERLAARAIALRSRMEATS